MPQPIVPIHMQQDHSALFDATPNIESTFGNSLSDIQSQLLGLPTREAATKKYSEPMLRVLEAISRSEDEVISVASALADNTGTKTKYYRVPEDVSDGDLLMLKTSGLIRGQGRSVVITEAGQVALRDQWLRSENALRAGREKEMFVHPVLEQKRKRAAHAEGRFQRVADSVQRVKKVIRPEE